MTAADRAREALRDAAEAETAGRALRLRHLAEDPHGPAGWLDTARLCTEFASATNDRARARLLRAASLCVSAWHASRPAEDVQAEAADALESLAAAFDAHGVGYEAGGLRAFARRLGDGASWIEEVAKVALAQATDMRNGEAIRGLAWGAVEALARVRRAKDGAASC